MYALGLPFVSWDAALELGGGTVALTRAELLVGSNENDRAQWADEDRKSLKDF
jgi:hypothetical protein